MRRGASPPAGEAGGVDRPARVDGTARARGLAGVSDSGRGVWVASLWRVGEGRGWGRRCRPKWRRHSLVVGVSFRRERAGEVAPWGLVCAVPRQNAGRHPCVFALTGEVLSTPPTPSLPPLHEPRRHPPPHTAASPLHRAPKRITARCVAFHPAIMALTGSTPPIARPPPLPPPPPPPTVTALTPPYVPMSRSPRARARSSRLHPSRRSTQ